MIEFALTDRGLFFGFSSRPSPWC